MPSVDLSPQNLLTAYSQGVFPMAGPGGRIQWYTADPRGIIPLGAFHIPKSLAQFMRGRNFPYQIHVNRDFQATMRQCMSARSSSWINSTLIRAYVKLHELGFAHSVETYNGNQLVGGLYGVSLGGAFFGESMFHTQRDASKVALVHLVGRLRERGYELLDSQAVTDHLRQFGCVEIPAAEYMKKLELAMEKDCQFAD